MKTLILTIVTVFISVLLSAQAEEGWYISGESEMIFSFADIEAPNELDAETVLRWSPVFNFAGHLNKDISDNLGFNIGLAIRNVGFISDFDFEDPTGDFNPDNINKMKFRTYNAGIPVGLKLGKLSQEKPFFLFAGYEIEFPLHYKQKEFDGGEKVNKRTAWFSDRVNPVQQAVWGGIQFPQGFALKFKYYLDNFFNEDFDNFKSDEIITDYELFNANVFYFSLEWFPFQNVDYYTNKME